jgi:hypothetical protein
MKDFKQNKEELNREMSQISTIINKLLPRYASLIKKHEISSIELTELGEIEHFLIEVNSKITEIKNMLDQNLYGFSIDMYYKLKEKAKKGDHEAKQKLDRMRENLNQSLKNDSMIIWN